MGKTPRFFIVAGHFHAGMRALQRRLEGIRVLAAGLLAGRGRFRRAVFFQDRKRLVRVRQAGKAGGTEEDHGVLDLFPAKTRERLGVLRQDADDASVRTAEKVRVEVSERRGLQLRLVLWNRILNALTHAIFKRSDRAVVTAGHSSGWPPARRSRYRAGPARRWRRGQSRSAEFSATPATVPATRRLTSN